MEPISERALLDFDGYLGTLPEESRNTLTANLDRIPDPGARSAEKQRLASMLAVSEATGLEVGQVSDQWDMVRGGFAEQQGGDWETVKDDEAGFFAKLKDRAVKGKDERHLLLGPDEPDNSEGRAESLVFKAQEAAYLGQSYADALIDWETANKHRPGFDPGKMGAYSSVAAEAHKRASETFAKARPIAEELFRNVSSGGMPARPLAGLSLEEKNAAFRVLADLSKGAGSEAKGAGKAFTEGLARSFENLRMGGAFGAQIHELSRAKFKAGDEVTQSTAFHELQRRSNTDLWAGGRQAGQKRTLTAEEAKEWNAQVEEELENAETFEQLRKFSESMERGGEMSWFAEKMVVPLAESLAIMGAMAASGPAAFQQAAWMYKGEEYLRLRDIGMSRKEADQLSLVTGMGQAGLDRLQLGVLTKGLPGTKRVLERFAMAGNTAARLGANVTGTLAAETAIELAQDHVIPALVQDNLASNPAFDVKWEKVWKEAAKAAPDVALGMILLAGMGGVAQTYNQGRAVNLLANSPAAMTLRGYTDAQIAEIQAAPAEAQGQLLAQYLPAKAPRGAEREALVAKAEKRAQVEQATFDAKARAEAGLVKEAANEAIRVSRRGSGWWVTTNERSFQVESAEAARRIRDDLKQANSQQEADALVSLVNQWTQAAPEGTERATTLTGDVVTTDGQSVQRTRFLETVEDGSFTAEGLEELRREAAMLGGGDLFQINGSNQFRQTVVDGATKLLQTLEINRSESAVFTFLHEAVETEYKRTGSATQAQKAIAAMRASFDPAKAKDEGQRMLFERVQKVADGNASETELRETFSELAVADILGRNKDGTLVEAGSISRALDTAIQDTADRMQVEGMTKIRSFFRAVKTYFRAIFATVAALRKAKKAGTSQDFEALVAKLLGVEEQVEHDASLADVVGEYIPPTAEEEEAGIAFSLTTLRNRYAKRGVKAEASESKDKITLNNLEVRESIRGHGMGSEFMRELAAYADRSGKRIVLGKQEAPEFFAKFGFSNGAREPGVAAFSVSASDRLGLTMKRLDAALAKDPKKRQALAKEGLRRLKALGKKFAEIPEKRSVRSLDKEGAFREATRREELERQGADPKEARATAKQETADWRKEQDAVQRVDWSDKASMVRDLQTYNAAISVLPPELRGKLGGFLKIAQLGEKARLDAIGERLERADELMEKYLREEYDEALDKLFARAKPKKDEAGKKRVGKIGADVHALFGVLEQAREWTPDEVTNHIDALELLVNTGNLTPEQEAHAKQEAALVNLIGDWKNATAERRATAVDNAQRVFDYAYADARMKSALLTIERKARRASLAADTGKAGLAGERDKMAEDAGVKAGWRDALIGLENFEQTMKWVFGETSNEAGRIVDMERKASYQATDEVQAIEAAISEKFKELAGNDLKGERLSYDLAQKSLDVGTRRLSEMEAITATMMWRQEDGRRHMEGNRDEFGQVTSAWSYDQAFIDEIEAKLSPEAKEMRAFLSDQYAGEYEGLNKVYRELNGIDLPHNPNYSPLTVKPVKVQGGQMLDPVTGSTMSASSTTPGALRNRGGSVAEPDFRDALQIFIAHTKQMAHWKAYAPMTTETRALLGNRELLNSVEAGTGAEATRVIGGWLDFFAQGGTRDAAAHLAINQKIARATGRAAQIALFGRLGTIAVQSTQLAAASAEMPFGAYVKRFAKLTTGQLDWTSALNSPYIQRRLKQMPPAVRLAMDGLRAEKPNALKHAMQRIGGLIAGADALFTAGTFAMILDYQRGQAAALGMTGPEAEAYALDAAERATDRVAQPTRPGARSLFENTATNPFVRLTFAFASEARKNLGLLTYALAKRPWKHKAQVMTYVLVLNSMIAAVIRNAWRDMRDDDDDELFDDQQWSIKRMALTMATEPMAGIPVFGDLVEAGAFKLGGEYVPQGNTLSGLDRAAGAFSRAGDWFNPEEDLDPEAVIRDIDMILSGMGVFNSTLAASANVTHFVRDVYGTADNFLPDSDEEAAKKERAAIARERREARE